MERLAVRFAAASAPYSSGDIARFPAAVARAYVEAGVAVPRGDGWEEPASKPAAEPAAANPKPGRKGKASKPAAEPGVHQG